MFVKILVTLTVLLIIYALFYPRRIPKLFRHLGRTVGDAGRVGHEMLTGEEIENSPLARYEVRAGEIVAMKLLAQHPVVADQALQQTIAELGARLARHAGRKEIPYRFTVVEAAEPNAFAVAGGSILVTRPLVNLCEGDVSCLAGVLGHEIIHVDRRHALRDLARSALTKGGLRLLSFGRGRILSRVVGPMQEMLIQGYHQEQELEADVLGSRLAAQAGFDPRGLILLLERLQVERPDGQGLIAEVLGYFETHPPLTTRIAHMRESS